AAVGGGDEDAVHAVPRGQGAVFPRDRAVLEVREVAQGIEALDFLLCGETAGGRLVEPLLQLEPLSARQVRIPEPVVRAEDRFAVLRLLGGGFGDGLIDGAAGKQGVCLFPVGLALSSAETSGGGRGRGGVSTPPPRG